jgi:hypothetical protein
MGICAAAFEFTGGKMKVIMCIFYFCPIRVVDALHMLACKVAQNLTIAGWCNGGSIVRNVACFWITPRAI